MKLGISDEDAEFLKALGDGSLARGLEILIRLGKAAVIVLRLRVPEDSNQKTQERDTHEPADSAG